MSERFDVAIVGGGPAGAVCGAHCAAAGLRTVILERANFPREKVCGDCLNPNCWPWLDELKLSERVLALPHARLRFVEFGDQRGRRLRFAMGGEGRGEIAVKRSHLDALLLARAGEMGAVVRQGLPVLAIERLRDEWRLGLAHGEVMATHLVAADGRNSTVARHLGLLPAAQKDRVGLQTHFILPPRYAETVAMRFHRLGYCGVADVGAGLANLCLVARPQRIEEMKAWANQRFELSPAAEWRTITPLARATLGVSIPRLHLVGDAQRVVEPFTGEGIYYALATAALAARSIIVGDAYEPAVKKLYQGRIWINALARIACTSPRVAEGILTLAQRRPALLQKLTSKVTGGAVTECGDTPAPTDC